jgi:arylsulfatase A-like enzyme
VDWLQQRPDRRRPFFAFLNYFDVHSAYMLPPGNRYRFGRPPKTDAEVQVLVDWFEIDKPRLPPDYRSLASDCYDSCLGYLDEKLGELFDELQRGGVLESTLVIVTSDHGEGLGEHNLFFHGESLYRTEIRVPLLIVLPGQNRPVQVRETISLRDLAATIADLAGGGSRAPFRGQSLSRLWQEARGGRSAAESEGAISELLSANPTNPNQGRSPIHRGALVSIAAEDYVYIRNEGDGSEELYNERDDANEIDNRAGLEATQAIKERLRTQLERMRADLGSSHNRRAR